MIGNEDVYSDNFSVKLLEFIKIKYLGEIALK